ncbi:MULTISPECIES: hypothetical protein [unclassified Holdemania]|nr:MULTISPECIES: hypothetical protein [unclassified Holdemania]
MRETEMKEAGSPIFYFALFLAFETFFQRSKGSRESIGTDEN